MPVIWTVGVLPIGVENVIELDSGVEPTATAAHAVAVDVLLRESSRRGRQEYRITVDGAHTIVLPGLAARGDVDVSGLEDAVCRVHAGAGPAATPDGTSAPGQ